MSRKPATGLREAPWAPEAEEAVLGALMHKPKALAEIADWLVESDFFSAKHRALYRAIVELTTRGVDSDPVTIAEWIEQNELGDIVGSSSAVLKMANATASASNIVAYADVVKMKSRLRQMIDIGTELQAEAFKPRAEPEVITNDALRKLMLMQTTRLGGGLVSARSMLGDFMQDLQAKYEADSVVTGLCTPWGSLDEATGGLQPGELTILAGRPSMGKTAAALAFLETVTRMGGDACMFSLEMSKRQLMARMVSSRTGIPYTWVRRPTSGAEKDWYWDAIGDATTMLAALPLYVDDTSGLTGQQIIARARRQYMRKPFGLCVIDHLQHVHLPGRNNKADEIGDFTKAAKGFAKEHNTHVIALSQLSRANTKRQDQRPELADLRGSGDIEQDADTVLGMHRQEYYEKGTHLKRVVEIKMLKGRDVDVEHTTYAENKMWCMQLPQWDGPLPVEHAKDGESARPKKNSLAKAAKDYAAGKDQD